MEGWLAQHNLLCFGNVIPKETDKGAGKGKLWDFCSYLCNAPQTQDMRFLGTSCYIFQQEVILWCTGLTATVQRRRNVYRRAYNTEEIHHVEGLTNKLKGGCSFVCLYMETITLKHSHQCTWLQSKSSMQTSQCFCLVLWEEVSLLVRTTWWERCSPVHNWRRHFVQLLMFWAQLFHISVYTLAFSYHKATCYRTADLKFITADSSF